MLALDSVRWQDLGIRSGSARGVPNDLEYLLEHPEDEERLADLSSELCSEGTTWSAAYAAAPYLLEIARKLPLETCGYALVTIGFIVLQGSDSDVPSDLLGAYRGTIPSALLRLIDTIHFPSTAKDLRYQFLALAALKGHLALAELMDVVDGEISCPACDESLGDVFEAAGIERKS
jgi:hypothetical protein